MELEFKKTKSYEGENNVCLLVATVDSEYIESTDHLQIHFVAPSGSPFFSDDINTAEHNWDSSKGTAEYAIPYYVLDANGVLQAQLVATNDSGTFVVRSKIYRYYVDKSIEGGVFSELHDDSGDPMSLAQIKKELFGAAENMLIDDTLTKDGWAADAERVGELFYGNRARNNNTPDVPVKFTPPEGFSNLTSMPKNSWMVCLGRDLKIYLAGQADWVESISDTTPYFVERKFQYMSSVSVWEVTSLGGTKQFRGHNTNAAPATIIWGQTSTDTELETEGAPAEAKAVGDYLFGSGDRTGKSPNVQRKFTGTIESALDLPMNCWTILSGTDENLIKIVGCSTDVDIASDRFPFELRTQSYVLHRHYRASDNAELWDLFTWDRKNYYYGYRYLGGPEYIRWRDNSVANVESLAEKMYGLDYFLKDFGAKTMMVERRPLNGSEFFSIYQSHLYPDGRIISPSTKYCRTGTISQSSPMVVCLGSDEYEWTINSYSSTLNPPGAENITRNNTSGRYVSAKSPVVVPLIDGDESIVIGIRRVDGEAITIDLEDPAGDAYKIQRALHIYMFPNKSDPVESLTFNFGGLARSGADYISASSTKRLRIVAPSSNGTKTGGIELPVGTVISAANGFKFNVAVYSRYVGNGSSENRIFSYRAPSQESFTMPINGAVRISIGKLDDADLWFTNSQNIREYTNVAPDNVTDAISFDFSSSGVGESLLDRISDLEDLSRHTDYGVMLLNDEIPFNAIEYHALWDSLTDWDDEQFEGFESSVCDKIRVLIGYGSDIDGEDDESLPIYMYALRMNKAHVDSSYRRTEWDGSNELYKKPAVLITSGVHGNERTTPFSVYDFVRRLLVDPEYAPLAALYDWYIIPLVNPWGFSHSLFKNGEAIGGSSYSQSIHDEIVSGGSEYVIVDNSENINYGIRQLANGSDPNRDFDDSKFNFKESQILRDTVAKISTIIDADEEANTFAFNIDAHQAGLSSILTNICAFASVHKGIEQKVERDVFGALISAGADATARIKNWLGITDDTPTVLPWDGTSITTIRNYMSKYSPASICFEGSENCTIYSQLTGFENYSNAVTRSTVNTILHLFIKMLCDESKNWV